MERKARGTKAESRSYPGTLGSDATGPLWFGWLPGLQLPGSLVGDRADSFDCLVGNHLKGRVGTVGLGPWLSCRGEANLGTGEQGKSGV